MAKELGIYRPRSPQESPFYQCIADHLKEFVQVYDERYEREYGFWRPVVAEVIEKFLECGDLTHKAKETLAQYIIKAPISQERMIYDRENQKIIYKSKPGTICKKQLPITNWADG